MNAFIIFINLHLRKFLRKFLCRSWIFAQLRASRGFWHPHEVPLRYYFFLSANHGSVSSTSSLLGAGEPEEQAPLFLSVSLVNNFMNMKIECYNQEVEGDLQRNYRNSGSRQQFLVRPPFRRFQHLVKSSKSWHRHQQPDRSINHITTMETNFQTPRR